MAIGSVQRGAASKASRAHQSQTGFSCDNLRERTEKLESKAVTLLEEIRRKFEDGMSELLGRGLGKYDDVPKIYESQRMAVARINALGAVGQWTLLFERLHEAGQKAALDMKMGCYRDWDRDNPSQQSALNASKANEPVPPHKGGRKRRKNTVT